MEFIKYLLNPDMKKRPNAEEALKHPWLQTAKYKSWDKLRTTNVIDNMSKFKASSLIHKTLYEYIGVHNVSSEERRNIDEIWNALDD